MDKEELERFRRDFCPIVNAISEIGDKWTLLVLRECFIGIRRFDDFQKNLGVSKSVLATKLGQMIEKDLLEKRSYKNPGERTRYEYRLTQKGKDLQKVVVSLLNWGNQYLVDKNQPTILVVDKEKVQKVDLTFVDKVGGTLSRWDLRLHIGQNKA